MAGPPLRERVSRGQTVAISACDITRPQPRHLMIPALLEELDGIVDLDDVVVLVATGTHRANTDAELRAMFGDDVVDSVRIVNHDSRAKDTMVWRGTFGRDVPVWLNREWSEADVRITTGFVEPHFFAGFSGGPKLVAPGLAALETVLVLHDAARIGDPRATWGITHGNPVHDDVRAIAEATGVTFALDVVLNAEQAIVEAFGGDILPMHEAATAFAKDVAMQPVDGRFDVVLTTGSGYPLDQNLYQSVKGMSAAYQVVRPGGMIVCAAECRDGFPDHGSYRTSLTSGASPEEMLADIAGRDRARSPTSGRCRSRRRSSPARAWSCTRRTSPTPTSPRPTSSRPPTSPAPSRRRCAPRGPAPGCACCPRGRRPSPTSPASCRDGRRRR